LICWERSGKAEIAAFGKLLHDLLNAKKSAPHFPAERFCVEKTIR
jgi:hypothetical protein